MKYKFTPENVTIYNSHLIRNEKEMEACLLKIRQENPAEGAVIHRRSITSLVNEWKAHNFLYDLSLYRSHTVHVDLNDEPWQRRLAYWLLARFYRP